MKRGRDNLYRGAVRDEKAAIRSLIGAYKLMGQKEGEKLYDQSVGEIVELAEQNMQQRQYPAAAENFELAAYACQISPYRTIKKRARQYSRKAEEAKRTGRDSGSSALEKAVKILFYLSFPIITYYIASNLRITGYSIATQNPIMTGSFLLVSFLILTILFIRIKLKKL